MIRRASDVDLPEVVSLLKTASLPVAGLAEHLDHLYVLEVHGAILGAVGYEAYPPYALLRSLIIAPSCRGQGYGRQLMVHILERARSDGMGYAYALTTTIPDLLCRSGFSDILRSDAPQALCASEEFRGACPVNAKLFRISLTDKMRGDENMDEKTKVKVLFLCTGNSCRSQMAEGWARHLKGDVIEPYSAGIETHGMNPNAVKVMAEAGVDISGHRSKHVDELMDVPFDYVVTVCDNAHESCPIFLKKAKVVHVGFDDPPRLAKEAKMEEEKLECYRRVRDEIRKFMEKCPEELESL